MHILVLSVLLCLPIIALSSYFSALDLPKPNDEELVIAIIVSDAIIGLVWYIVRKYRQQRREEAEAERRCLCHHGMPRGLTRRLCVKCAAEASQKAKAEAEVNRLQEEAEAERRRLCPHGMPGGLTRRLCVECTAEARQKTKATVVRLREEAEAEKRLHVCPHGMPEGLTRRLCVECAAEAARHAAEVARHTAEQQRQQEAREHRQQEEESRAHEDWIATHKRLQFDQLDHLTGPEFEQRLAILFRHQGYCVELTKGSGDQGADLLLSNGNVRIAVQAKRYTARVGNSAIQELLGGMAFYNCSQGMVITTSDFTRSAKELAAKATGVELWERSTLRNHFMRAFPYDPPAFSWDAYRRLKKYL